MRYIENKTFDEMKVGDSAQLVKTLTQNDIDLFAVLSGDVNPAHVDVEYAKTDHFHKIIAHGMWGGALISAVLGTKLPGPGTIYLSQDLKFKHPVAIGDTLTITVTVLDKEEKKHHVTLSCTVINQNQEIVIDGNALVIAPTEKITRPRIELPEIIVRNQRKLYHELIKKSEGMPPLKTAVVHPVDPTSLQGAIESAQANLIDPILVGPKEKILKVAESLKIDISPYEIVSTHHSHHSAETAVKLAREKKVFALMKGALHTDELLRAILHKELGLRTERRMSHVFVMEVSTYPRLLLITDAAINIEPDLDEKRDIVQNAVDLAHSIGIKEPRVAVLSATEFVSGKIRSTLDAAALCKMVDRGQIQGCIMDGPLAFDAAISEEATKIKNITSSVAGKADIFVVPNLETGNMLIKQLEYLGQAETAGIALGAKVPIILTSRSDNALTRMASCVLAQLFANAKKHKIHTPDIEP